MKVIVLGGGDSPERKVSLRSASAVATAARQAGFEVAEIDPANGYEQLDDLKDHIILPILHGKNGEDGTVQEELEKRGLAFLGSDSEVSKLCFDKWQTRQKLEKNTIPMAKAMLVDRKTYAENSLAKRPHVLKIIHGGSSIGVLVVRDPKKIDDHKINELFNMEDMAVLEELITGTEITVPILDKSALPVIEIRPPADKEFDYVNKYNGATAELCPPRNVPASLQNKARALAESVHEIMGARHLSRIDMMVDDNEKIYVLEINTMPGLTDQSLYPRSAAASGMPMLELIRKFVSLVERDHL